MTIISDLDRGLATFVAEHNMKVKPGVIRMGPSALRGLAACLHYTEMPTSYRAIPIEAVEAPSGSTTTADRFLGWSIEAR